jgi:hypothetical protein
MATAALTAGGLGGTSAAVIGHLGVGSVVGASHVTAFQGLVGTQVDGAVFLANLGSNAMNRVIPVLGRSMSPSAQVALAVANAEASVGPRLVAAEVAQGRQDEGDDSGDDDGSGDPESGPDGDQDESQNQSGGDGGPTRTIEIEIERYPEEGEENNGACSLDGSCSY